MRRLAACIVLLIQFCVQCVPQTLAEEPMVAEGIPIHEYVPETETGSIVDDVPMAESGAVVASGSGSNAAGSGEVLVPIETVEAPPVLAPLKVVITEVLWMGSNLSTADEWVEIAAFSSGSAVLPVSLAGWKLVGVKAGVETVLAEFPAEPLLSSGSVRVIANNAAATSRLAAEPAVVTTGMSLPNTQLLLRLKDGSGTVVDQVDDGIGAPFAGANPSGGAKASMERVDAWVSGTIQTNWRTATLSLGFDEGPQIFGTPGTLGLKPEPAVIIPEDVPEPESLPLPPVQSIAPALRLTEILANPIGVDTDEWIETGSFDVGAVDLAELTLRTGTVRFQLSGTLEPGAHRRFGKVLSGLSLPNSSGTVELLWRDRVIDTWTYGESPEGVSLGRAADGSILPQCVPSPDLPNTGASLNPEIHVQSSNASAGKLTLNLEARVPDGSMAEAVCVWTYPDGFSSQSCNPPSHTMPGPLEGDIFLTLHDACGNTLTRILHVDVSGKSSTKEDEPEGVLCTPTAFTGVVVSEVFPNPAGDEEEGEWIELENPSGVEKSLCGWSLDDGERGSDPFRLDHLRLHPGDRLIFPRAETDIALNNDRDAVRLFSPFPYGGSGAYEIVRYEASPEGASFARRSDGTWLWNDAPSPMVENGFAEPKWPDEVLVRVIQALPNPSGDDGDGGEWIEIQNMTRFPLPLTGWSVETASDDMLLGGIILAPLERKRLEVDPDLLALTNANGFVRLLDRDGLRHSLFAWDSAKDGTAVRPPEQHAHLSEFTFTGTEDCVTWHMKDADGVERTASLDGIEARNISACIDFVSALLEGQKFDLEMYSEDETRITPSLRGVDLSELILEKGLALIEEEKLNIHYLRYAHAEASAREGRRGVWADAEFAVLLDASRALSDARRTLAEAGLQIDVSHASGIVDAGEVLEIETNVPASVSVAVGTGAFESYAGPIVLDRDLDIRIEAVAEAESVTGADVLARASHSYALLRSRYPHLRISEVYPSPKKGEEEWIEVWNPSDESVRLVGWTIDDAPDAGSTVARLPADSVIEPGGRLLLASLPVAWNNGGDTVRLIAPNGKESHRIAYDKIKNGVALAMHFAADGSEKGACDTVHPTPGKENRCAEAIVAPKKKKASATTVARRRTAARKVRYRNLVEANPVQEDIDGLFSDLLAGAAQNRDSIHWLLFIAGISSLFCVAAAGVFLALRERRRIVF